MNEPIDNSSDKWKSTKRVTYEWDEKTPPAVAIVEAVAATTGREPTNLPPLYEYVDGEALDTLLQSGSGSRPGDIEVTFRYEGVQVSVRSDGSIVIVPDVSGE